MASEAPPWWQDPNAVLRHVRDVIWSEWQQLRPSPGHIDPYVLSPDTLRALHLVRDLGADSLELLSLSAALSDAVPRHSAADADALYADLRMAHWVDVATRSWAQGADTLRFRTSGSSGAPKTCRHPLADLTQEVRELSAVLGPFRRIVSAVRCHHIYGFLFTLLLPRQAVWAAPGQALPVLDMAGRPPHSVLAQLQAGDLVVGFPDWWRAIGRSGHALPPGVIGVTSTAPCPDEVCAPLMAAGLSRLVHIYGSTETAGIGWRDWPQAHYTLLPSWQRVPNEPQLLARATPDGGWRQVSLPDAVTWDDERSMRPTGRLDGAVQVGGINVHLGVVRQQFLALDQVADAVLRLHSFAGQARLKLFVVPRDPAASATELVSALQQHAQRHLAPPARPAHITVGAALPVNAQGKACDWPVPDASA